MGLGSSTARTELIYADGGKGSNLVYSKIRAKDIPLLALCSVTFVDPGSAELQYNVRV